MFVCVYTCVHEKHTNNYMSISKCVLYNNSLFARKRKIYVVTFKTEFHNTHKCICMNDLVNVSLISVLCFFQNV